jgi:hypothetical protein
MHGHSNHSAGTRWNSLRYNPTHLEYNNYAAGYPPVFGWNAGHGPVPVNRCAKETRPVSEDNADAAVELKMGATREEKAQLREYALADA